MADQRRTSRCGSFVRCRIFSPPSVNSLRQPTFFPHTGMDGGWLCGCLKVPFVLCRWINLAANGFLRVMHIHGPNSALRKETTRRPNHIHEEKGQMRKQIRTDERKKRRKGVRKDGGSESLAESVCGWGNR